jgi:hypothetical protein
MRLARTRRLDVDDSRDSCIDGGDVHGAARLERHLETPLAEPAQQRQTIRLRERLAAGHAHILGAE